MKTYRRFFKTLIFISLLLAPLKAVIADSIVFLSVLPGNYNTDKKLNIVPLKKDLDISYTFINIKTESKKNDISTIETDVPYIEPLYLTAIKGEERQYSIVLQVSEKDKVLEKRILRYTIDKRKPIAAEVSVKSGEYYKPLAITFNNHKSEQVFYSLNGDIYNNPKKWNGKVLYLNAADSEEKRFHLDYYSKDAAGNKSPIKSYTYVINHKKPYLKVLSPIDGDYANYQLLYIVSKHVQWVKYTLDGSDPVKNGILYKEPAVLKYSGNLNLRIAAKPGWNFDFHYLRRNIFIKIKPENELSITNDFPSGIYKRGIKLNIKGYKNGKIFYTLSEKTPRDYDFLYKTKIYLKSIPSAKKLYTLRIRELKNNGQWGKEYRYFYIINRRKLPEPVITPKSNEQTLNNTPPPLPVITVSYPKTNKGSCVLETKSLKGIDTLYEIALFKKPPNIKAGVSPIVDSPLTLTVPYGMQGEFYIRFASVNSSGNVTPARKMFHLSIDRKPPGEPSLNPAPGDKTFDHGIKVLVNNREGKVFYNLTSDGTTPDDPTENSSVLKDKLELKGKRGKAVRYDIKMLCKDDNRNFSRVFGPYTYTVDLRTPVVPHIKGFENDEKYKSASVLINIPNRFPRMHYTFSDNGKEPADPDLKSPIVRGGSLEFKGPSNKETKYIVKLLPVSSNENIKGTIKTLRFTIDRKPPAVPEIAGVKEGAVYRKQVNISAKRTEPGESLFISYSTTEVPPPDPLKYGEELKNKLIFDVKDGEEKTFKLRLAAVDKAGNRSIYDRFFSFTIDKKPPESISIDGIPQNGVSNDAVVISMHSSEGTIYFSTSNDGSIPVIPGYKAKKYEAPFILTGIPNKEVTYKLIARAVDEAGNFTRGIHVYNITVDRKAPKDVPDPIVKKYANGRKVIWNVPEDYRIYYKLNSKFTLYTKPVSLRKTNRIYYYLMDKAGNKSHEKSMLIEIPFFKITPPSITGVKNGNVYNHSLQIGFLTKKGVVRYEISVDGTEPPPVTSESPIANGLIPVDVIDGDTVSVKINARVFDDSGNYSSLSSVEFVLDKTPPRAPMITGVKNNGHYQDTKKVSLLNDEGTIYYSVSSDGKDPEIPRQTNRTLYKKEIVLPAVDGKIKDYRILAYSVDAAGNRSRDIPVWHVIIDRKIIYVSNEGNDLYPGTASRPFHSLQKAVQAAQKEGRSVIHIASGIYKLNIPIKVNNRKISIYGGFEPHNWHSSSFQKTEITAGKYLGGSNPLIAVSGGGLFISDCSFYNKTKDNGPLIRIDGGELSLKDSFINTRGKHSVTGITQTSGKLTITGCELSSGKAEKVELINSSGGFLSIDGSDLEGFKNLNIFTGLNLSNNSNVILRGININPGTGNSIIAIKAQNTRINLAGGSLSSGIGSKQSIALVLKNADASLLRTRINTESKSPYPVAVFAEGSKVKINRSFFKISGAFGATGLQVKDSDITFTKNRVEGGFPHSYLYIVNLTGSGYFSNNVIYNGGSGDFIAVQLYNSASYWFNNTIVAGAGKDLTAGFYIDLNSHPKIVNNIIVREGAEKGDGIFISGKDKVDFPIITNDIAGWKNVLKLVKVRSMKSSIYKYQKNAQSLNIKKIEDMNNADRNPFGGLLNGNITENIKKTFLLSKEISKGNNFHLSPSSSCINNGTGRNQVSHLKLQFNVPKTDFDDQMRPAPLIGIKPIYDIGADEVY